MKGSRVQSQVLVHSEFKTSLDYMRHCFPNWYILTHTTNDPLEWQVTFWLSKLPQNVSFPALASKALHYAKGFVLDLSNMPTRLIRANSFCMCTPYSWETKSKSSHANIRSACVDYLTMRPFSPVDSFTISLSHKTHLASQKCKHNKSWTRIPPTLTSMWIIFSKWMPFITLHWTT